MPQNQTDNRWHNAVRCNNSNNIQQQKVWPTANYMLWPSDKGYERDNIYFLSCSGFFLSESSFLYCTMPILQFFNFSFVCVCRHSFLLSCVCPYCHTAFLPVFAFSCSVVPVCCCLSSCALRWFVCVGLVVLSAGNSRYRGVSFVGLVLKCEVFSITKRQQI